MIHLTIALQAALHASVVALAPALPPVSVGIVAVDTGDVDVDAVNAAVRAAVAAARADHDIDVVDPDALRLREATRGCDRACRRTLVVRRGASWIVSVDADGDATVVRVAEVAAKDVGNEVGKDDGKDDGKDVELARRVLSGPRYRRTADADAAVFALLEELRPKGRVLRDHALARGKNARVVGDIDAAAAGYAAAFDAVDDDDSVDCAVTWLRLLDERAAEDRDAAYGRAAARILTSSHVSADARERFAQFYVDHLVDVAERATGAADAAGPDQAAAAAAACAAWRAVGGATTGRAEAADIAARAAAAASAVCAGPSAPPRKS